MLQDMRDKAQGWVAKVIVAAIAFTFAIFGLESLRPDSSNPEIAEVNGTKITQRQLMESVDQQRRMLFQQMGENFDPSMIDERLLQRAALESLIQRTLMRDALKTRNMVVSEQLLDQFIRTTPEFQVEGRYNPDRVMQYVRSVGMTVPQFRSMLREQLASTQLQAGIAGTEFMTAYELQRLSDLQGQTRDISWLTLKADKARAAVELSGQDIQDYYEASAARFMKPEQVSVNYVILDKARLAENIKVSENDIQTRYASHVADLKEKAGDQHTASMILLETGDEKAEADALNEAKELKAKLDGGADFAALAKEFSDDPDSAEKGGSLGVVETGFFGDDFDDNLDVLKAGEISAPFVTDFGVVILRRDKAAEARIPSLEQMRASLEKELRSQSADPLFVEKSQKLADDSFEASDLTQPAENLGLEIHKSGLFGKDGQGADELLANPRVIAAAFSDEVLNQGANSDLVEVGPDQVMVLRVNKHNKAEQMPLADVRASIETSLRSERGEEQLQARVEKLITELDGGTDVKTVAKETGVDWKDSKTTNRFSKDAPAQLLAQAFRMPHPEQGKSSYGSVQLPDGDIALIRVSAVTPGKEKVDKDTQRMMGATLGLRHGSQIFGEYQRDLRQHAEIEVKTSSEGES